MWVGTISFWIISSGWAVHFNSEGNYERVRYIAGPRNQLFYKFIKGVARFEQPLLFATWASLRKEFRLMTCPIPGRSIGCASTVRQRIVHREFNLAGSPNSQPEFLTRSGPPAETELQPSRDLSRSAQ